METVAFGTDTWNIASRIILSEAGIDGVFHQHAQHCKESVRTLGLMSPEIPHDDDVPALKPRDRFVPVLFAQAINNASIS
jgi:hypothetical protein